MKTVKRIVLNQCCGVIIDVQEFSLAQLDADTRSRIETNTMGFARMLGYLQVPVLSTVERPLKTKGAMPKSIGKYLSGNDAAETFEKDFFDLTKHQEITGYLRSLKKKQLIVGGCETDVGLLQSCLGLLSLGYEIYVVEDLLFSSSREVHSAVQRMKDAGAIFVSLKTLYYELLEAVETSPQRRKIVEKFGPFPKEL